MQWCDSVHVYICFCVYQQVEYACVVHTYSVCVQVRVSVYVCIILFSLGKKGIQCAVWLHCHHRKWELKQRQGPPFSAVLCIYWVTGWTGQRGGSSHLPHDYSVPLTACLHGAEIRGNNFDGKNAQLVIYYSQKQSLNQYACTPVASWNLTYLLPSIINHLQSCVPFWFGVSKISVNYIIYPPVVSILIPGFILPIW